MILLTTCLNPHNITKRFAKEMIKVFPNSCYYKRGNYSIEEIVNLCKTSNYKTLIIIHEIKGEPSQMIITDLPFGPSYFFNLSKVYIRQQLSNYLLSKGEAELAELKSEGKPYLILENFSKPVGMKVKKLLCGIFPVVTEEERSKSAVVFFADGYKIHFRNKKLGFDLEPVLKNNKVVAYKKKTNLEEIGPRFTMKLYKITEGMPNEKYRRNDFQLFLRKKEKDFL
eukprot:GAHX01001427.1.p1 GENE.GAHX01001427.1~~GAHX01001427.1.p1  ORF type:complete len:226 (+),score=39.07 GAHX01001427.1:46-723(+)